MEKIYLRTGDTDMRKQLDGLVDIIQYSFQLDPYSNSRFLFCGKRADRIKAVYYEGDGFCLFYKRYEKRPSEVAAHRGRSPTDLPSTAALVAGGPFTGTAKSSPQMGSSKVRKFLINAGKSCCFMVE